MKVLSTFKTLLKSSPLVRILLLLTVIGVIALVTSLSGRTKIGKPEISSIDPPIGSPGDTVVISGKNFGRTKESSFVEIAGSRVTASGYKKWSDTEVELTVPVNVQDGLVIVQTSEGRSEPVFFANESTIPVAVRTDFRTTVPVMDSISPLSARVGDVVTIVGSNFGAVRGNSTVYFAANRESSSAPSSVDDSGYNADFICASEADYDFEYWSDNEIHVRVPDGAASGPVYVATDKGNSYRLNLAVNFPVGQKSFSTRRTYVIQISADIQNRTTDDARVTLYVPRPAVSASQPSAVLSEVNPIPLIQDDSSNVIHQVQLTADNTNRLRFNQTFIITTLSVSNGVNEDKVSRFSDRSRLLYSAYTAPDTCVPSSEPDIIELALKIVGKTTNPYAQAKLIYNYMISNFKILNTVRSGDVSVLDLLERGSGDAYDFAMIFTALCRAIGIPAIPVSGVLIENNSTTRNHWWCEIYFERYGWFPVDVALAAGLNYKAFSEIENTEEYYFGNMDSQHIAFSRKWNGLKQSLINSRTVFRPRTYALQSMWEEVSNAKSNYSSLWNDPVVVGIY